MNDTVSRRAFIEKAMIAGSSLALSPLHALAAQKGTPIFGRTDPAKYQEAKGAHGGAGSLHLMTLLPGDLFDTNVIFFHRGILSPKSSIGEHIHRNMEEMYFIFNGRAEFTVNGKTALLPAMTTVACPRGSSHGIYNCTDEDLEWLNIGITMVKGKGDAVDYGDDLSNKRLCSPAPFKWGNFDRTLLKPVTGAHDGKGDLMFRRVWAGDSFKTNWEWIDHCLLPPDTSIGYHQHNAIEEVYYILDGNGRMTVNDTTWDARPHDAFPCTLHDSHGIYNNTDRDLELFVCAISMKKGVFNAKNWGDDLSNR